MSDYFSQEEITNIISALEEMESKPPARSSEEFKAWMEEYRYTDEDEMGYKPTISPFFGSTTAGTTYDIWRYEVKCLIVQKYTHDIIKEAIRRSLKGEAIHIVKRLGPEATIDDIVERMDSIYGSVEPKEALLGQFYTARQEDHEDVAAWGCRLEDILNKAKQRGKVRDEDANDMLTSKFFEGLRPQLKDISRYKKDTIQDFDAFLKAVRIIEQEHNLRPVKQPSTKLSTSEKQRIKQLTARIDQLTAEVKTLKEEKEIQNQNINMYQTHQDVTGYNQSYSDRHVYHHKPPIRCWRCNQQGHIARNCTVRMDHRKNGQIYQQMYTTKDALGTSRKQFNNMVSKKDNSDVVGKATESTVTINGITTEALLDTGSTVSTISKEFYDQHLSHTPIESLDHFLQIECADGKQLPYLGYIEANLTVPGLPSESSSCLFLIVPTSKYHTSVPILLGTNILSVLMESTKQKYGQRFLQDAHLYTPWFLAFRFISMREKDLCRNNNRLAIVRNTEQKRT